MPEKKIKREILEAATDLFSRFGFRGVSMNMIAGKVNVTKPVLYYYYKNKDDLYLEAAGNSFRTLMGEMGSIIGKGIKSPKEKLLAVSKKYLDLGLKERSFAKMVSRESLEKKNDVVSLRLVELKRRSSGIFEKIFTELYKERKLLRKRKPKDDAVLLMGAIDGLAVNAGFLEKRKNAKKQIEKIASLIAKVDK